MRLLDAVGAPEGTTLAHLMGSWRDVEGASRSSNSPDARAVNTSRDGVSTAELKRTLAAAARTAPQELDAKTRQELMEYLRRAFAHVHRFHPLTSPALGKGDSSAGALVDAVDTGVRNELATKVSRFFDAFSPKDARAEKMPRWCGDPSDSALQDMWGAGRDLVWLVALVAWLQERDVKAEAGLTFHRRVSRRYNAASGRTLPVTPERVLERRGLQRVPQGGSPPLGMHDGAVTDTGRGSALWRRPQLIGGQRALSRRCLSGLAVLGERQSLPAERHPVPAASA